MSDETSTALSVALAYHRAWAEKNLDEAMTYIADDIVCDAPAGRIAGAVAYRQFLGGFLEMLLDTEMIGAFGDEHTALVMYDTRTVPVASAPGAEYVTVADGKIAYSRFLFDRAPFEAARRAAAG